jgi:hypothetical protein
MEVDLVRILLSWLLHVDLACVVCNWDPASQSYVPWVPAAGGVGAAVGTGIGLNDLFGNTGRFSGVGDTANPTYSDTSADDSYSDTSVDDQIAQDDAEQQRYRQEWQRTNPGATTAGPPQPTVTQQGGTFIHRGIRGGIINNARRPPK